MRNLPVVGFATFALVSFASADAFAQKIRTYTDQAESEYGTSSPRTPLTPATSGATSAPTVTSANTDATPAADGEEAAADTTSYVTVFQPGGASQPLPVDLTPDQMYRGVIPGTRDEVSHLSRAQSQASDSSNRNALTWVGFQATDDTTRVFFQTGRSASPDLSVDGSQLKVTFNDTRLSARNFGRFIDTTFFNRNVTRIEVKQVDRTTVVATISLRESEQPSVDRSGNYVYLNFSTKTLTTEPTD